ncbi:MAG: hypothetical protein ACYCPT_10920 [Acidimicrobiales bacterium]
MLEFTDAVARGAGTLDSTSALRESHIKARDDLEAADNLSNRMLT